MIAVHLKFCLFGFHLFGLSSHCFCSYLQNKSHCLHKSDFNLFNEFNHLKLHSSGIWANNSIKCVNCIVSLYEVRPNRVHAQCTSEYYCNRKSTHKFTKTFRTHIQIDAAAALLTHVSKIICVYGFHNCIHLFCHHKVHVIVHNTSVDFNFGWKSTHSTMT